MKFKHHCQHCDCGKIFYAKSKNKKYCSKACRAEAIRIQSEKRGQPCILCKRATGGCSWSDAFKPVDGWVAEPTIVKDHEGDFSSFKIKYCPLYIRG